MLDQLPPPLGWLPMVEDGGHREPLELSICPPWLILVLFEVCLADAVAGPCLRDPKFAALCYVDFHCPFESSLGLCGKRMDTESALSAGLAANSHASHYVELDIYAKIFC